MVKLGGNYSFVEKEKEATMLRQPKQRVNSYVEVKPFAATRIVLSHQFVGKEMMHTMIRHLSVLKM